MAKLFTILPSVSFSHSLIEKQIKRHVYKNKNSSKTNGVEQKIHEPIMLESIICGTTSVRMF